MKLVFIVSTLVLLLTSNLSSQGKTKIDEESNFDKIFEQSYQKKLKGGIIDSVEFLEPVYKMRGVPFPEGDRNYNFNHLFSAAGDVNGDGNEDLFFVIETANEKTPELEDKVVKTVIYFGSETGVSKENVTVVREDLRFIEDITNDGISEAYRIDGVKLSIVVDNSNGQLSSFTVLDIPKPENVYVDSQGDFNQDGFNDLLLYSAYASKDTTQTVYIVYGKVALESLEIDTLQIEGVNKGYQRLFHTDVNNDNEMELIQVTGFDGINSQVRVRIYQNGENGEIHKIDEVDISSDYISNYLSLVFGGVGFADLNNDGKEELILLSVTSNTLWAFSLSESEGVYYTEDNVYQIATKASSFSILGDYDNDQHVDLFVTGEENKFMKTDSVFNVSANVIPLGKANRFVTVSSRTKEQRAAGDINGDGFNDLVFVGVEEDTLSYRTYFGNSNGDLSDYKQLNFNIANSEEETAFATTNIGDLNNDGIEDFSISYLKDNKLEIYFNGFEGEPSRVFLAKNEGRQFPPVSGDFNGDGINDLILRYASNSVGLSSKFQIYFGGTNFDLEADYTLNFTDLYPELDFGTIGNVSNIGDVNHDGKDDIAIASYQENKSTFILFGGTTISSKPDLKVPFFASNAINGKDFNKDGLNDFFIINTQTNEFYLMNGFRENESFHNTPVAKLSLPPRNFDSNDVLGHLGQTAAIGDFDGDSNMDLAVSALSHYNLLDRSGISGIYLFKGGSELDSLVDGSIDLPISLYGGNGQDSSNDYYNANRGAVATVPDQNGDRKDELLFSSGLYQTFGASGKDGGLDGATNSVLYFGNEIDQLSNNPSIIMRPPNERLGFGVQNSTVDVGQNIPAIGDFNGDGHINFLFIQEKEWNFSNEPVYVYELSETLVSTEEYSPNLENYTLSQNYPNPFNPSTTISYSIPRAFNVSLKIYDITGRLVSTLVDKKQSSGNYTVSLNASAWASGVYFYRIIAGDYIKTKKFTLIK